MHINILYIYISAYKYIYIYICIYIYTVYIKIHQGCLFPTCKSPLWRINHQLPQSHVTARLAKKTVASNQLLGQGCRTQHSFHTGSVWLSSALAVYCQCSNVKKRQSRCRIHAKRVRSKSGSHHAVQPKYLLPFKKKIEFNGIKGQISEYHPKFSSEK